MSCSLYRLLVNENHSVYMVYYSAKMTAATATKRYKMRYTVCYNLQDLRTSCADKG